ncbi:MAG: 30S ribosomal protein S14, partial [Geminicoccales bacterium]
MAKKSAIEKNQHRRQMVQRYTTKRAELKAIVRDRTRAPEERFEATLLLAELPRNSAKVRVRNRCALTGRPRGYHR